MTKDRTKFAPKSIDTCLFNSAKTLVTVILAIIPKAIVIAIAIIEKVQILAAEVRRSVGNASLSFTDLKLTRA